MINRSPKQSSCHKKSTNRWLLVISVVVLLIGGISLVTLEQDDFLDDIENINGHLLNRKLLSIADNQWIKIYPQNTGLLQVFSMANPSITDINWHRQGHAGLAFDSKYKSLLTFGSNTHGEDWDNRVHEFNLLSLKWTEHYPSSPKETYRADQHKNPIAGETALFPWAMHTYDNVSYLSSESKVI